MSLRNDTQTLQEQLNALAKEYPTIRLLRNAICDGSFDLSGSNCPPKFVLWKLLLLYESYDIKTWTTNIETEHRKFEQLKTQFNVDRIRKQALGDQSQIQPQLKSPLLGTLEHANDEDPFVSACHDSKDNPLLDQTEDSSAQETLQLIAQDVYRTYPDQPWLKTLTKQIHEVLFIYSEQHPEVGYRQGMNELCVPTLYLSQQVDCYPECGNHTEAQAFAVFVAIMERAKPWYLPAQGPLDTPMIVTRAQHIQEHLLKIADKDLYDILTRNEIEPQLWAMKWLRLLFGREVGLDNLFLLWTLIFAADPSLEIADYICVVLILRIESRLAHQDTTGILKLLLDYPWDVNESLVVLVQHAVQLRNELSPLTGLKIKLAYNPAMQYTEGFETFVKKLDIGANIDSVKSFANKFTKKLYHNEYQHDKTGSKTSSDPDANANTPYQYTERNSRIAELVDDSLKVLEKLHFNDSDIQVNRALQNLRLVYSYLQDPDKPVEAPESSRPMKSSKLPETRQKQSSESTQSQLQSPQKPSNNSSHNEFIRLTPARTSLAQSDFSWMLSSPDTHKPSGFKPRAKKDKKKVSEAVDLFDLS